MARVSGKKNEIKNLRKRVETLQSHRELYPTLTAERIATHERRIAIYENLLIQAEAE